jgi:SAM-dependent methyltransferase
MRRLGLITGLALGAIFMRVSEVSRRGARFFTAVAWGLSRRHEIAGLVRKHWDSERNTKKPGFSSAGLTRWEEELYRGAIPAGGRVCLIGCGSGRDLIGLAQNGYRVDGVDFAPEMIHSARINIREAGIKAGLIYGDIRTVDLPAEPYDAFVFSAYVYSLIPGRPQRVEILRKIRSRLSAKGCIVITYQEDWQGSAGRMAAVAGRVAKLTGNADGPERGDHFPVDHDFHHTFLPGEFEEEIRRAGCHVDRFLPMMEMGGVAAILSSSVPEEDQTLRPKVSNGSNQEVEK